MALLARGADVARLARNEAGGHRWQRVPPNEKRGRVHTSTVTVAVLPVPDQPGVQLTAGDVEVRTTGAGGAGGQHVNKRDTAVVATHRATGTRVRIEGRSQHLNREAALEILRARLEEVAREQQRGRQNRLRQTHVGSGMRGDKRRTVAVQRDTVVDHENARDTTVKRYLRGYLEDLWR